jgi:hypothetical protein
MNAVARILAGGLSVNRVGFGLVYLLAPARGGQGWIGQVARDPATQVFVRGHGARDIALGGGAIVALLRGDGRVARGWMTAQAIADGSDVYATLVSRPRLPSRAFRFALVMTSVSTAVAAASVVLLAATDDGGGAEDGPRPSA